MDIFHALGRQFQKPTGKLGQVLAVFMNQTGVVSYQYLIKHLGIKGEEPVLELGIGNGVLLKQVAEKYPTVPLYGVDYSEDMLQVASKRLAKLSAPDIFLKKMDINQLRFPKDFFQTIYTRHTLYFLEDPQAFLQRVYQILQPGGRFLVVYFSKEWLSLPMYNGYRFYKPDTLALTKYATQLGFSHIQTQTIFPKLVYCTIFTK
ncbi:class I SAM-dependent methyltransferase [Vagococcus humatus]|uniref:Methyltransferase domain-containing protein n=1 Tax=Vagococcus humatus TaxID=1889241 RepID=A0A3R9ZXF6_9ENTE|nr:class I SAM-dependent methyltransferase [Vagococcus humatus]RST89982.1 hypothetical protein C7P63_02570 [Vagococcus humatus]